MQLMEHLSCSDHDIWSPGNSGEVLGYQTHNHNSVTVEPYIKTIFHKMLHLDITSLLEGIIDMDQNEKFQSYINNLLRINTT